MGGYTVRLEVMARGKPVKKDVCPFEICRRTIVALNERLLAKEMQHCVWLESELVVKIGY